MDVVAEEEPLEIRINGESLSVTMRTPGNDFALAAGFLAAEGIIRTADDIESMAYCQDPDPPDLHNIINVFLSAGWNSEDRRWKRHFTASSSCGVCGKASIEAVRVLADPLPNTPFRTPARVIYELPGRMRAAQSTFEKTGGLHAAALFDGNGALLSLAEDVGRHNAVDKLSGEALFLDRLPLDENILMVSGRTSFEIMQKAAVARVPVLCAVSAPSSLAVQLARELNITLIGFLRGESMNVYAAPERIIGWESDGAR